MDILAGAELACRTAVEGGGAMGDSGNREKGKQKQKHPPAELYEVAARALARAGMWEEAASAVRRLEVRHAFFFLTAPDLICCCTVCDTCVSVAVLCSR